MEFLLKTREKRNNNSNDQISQNKITKTKQRERERRKNKHRQNKLLFYSMNTQCLPSRITKSVRTNEMGRANKVMDFH